MAGRFVGFNDLVVGRRYRIVEPSPLPYVIPTISIGVISRPIVITSQESKNYVRRRHPSSQLMGIITIRMDNEVVKQISAKPETIYEELDAAGGRRRKSRRSHRKSRRSHRRNTRL